MLIVFLAAAHYNRGDLKAAAEVLAQTPATRSALGAPPHQIHLLTLGGMVHYAQGNLRQGWSLLQQALELAEPGVTQSESVAPISEPGRSWLKNGFNLIFSILKPRGLALLHLLYSIYVQCGQEAGLIQCFCGRATPHLTGYSLIQVWYLGLYSPPPSAGKVV